MTALLGLPLEEAIRRLRAEGVEPTVDITRAPRRPEGIGALRVVRVSENGRVVTACAFLDTLREDAP